MRNQFVLFAFVVDGKVEKGHLLLKLTFVFVRKAKTTYNWRRESSVCQFRVL